MSLADGFRAIGGSERRRRATRRWSKRPEVKAFLAMVMSMAVLVFIRFIVHHHDNLFIAAEGVHALGIAMLIYRLTKERTCAGLCPPPYLSRFLGAF